MVEQPITLKNNGQINIILNNETKRKNRIRHQFRVLPKKLSINHEPLREIEREMSGLVGMEELKKNDKRNICVVIY